MNLIGLWPSPSPPPARATPTPSPRRSTTGPSRACTRSSSGSSRATGRDEDARLGGQDEKGVTRSEPFNPLTGPFFVEGAEPGDALVVRIAALRMNRDWGWSAFRLGLFALTPEDVEHVYSNVYKADLVRPGPVDAGALGHRPGEARRSGSASRRAARLPMEFRRPADARLHRRGPGGRLRADVGALGGLRREPRLQPDRRGGGGDPAGVPAPVALLFVGDGHALQGDGEATGTGIETSMDVETGGRGPQGCRAARARGSSRPRSSSASGRSPSSPAPWTTA